jgi:D-methionine transport system ATP-binding protein
MISLVGVSKRYESRGQTLTAVNHVSLDIASGEIFGIIGHSGAGKSTLLRCINLLETPTEGEVWVDGVNLTALPPAKLQQQRRKIGMVFQHFHLLHSATVADNIAFPLKLARVPKAQIKERVNELLDLVGLQGHGSKYPAQLSGGQKQRVGIARALASHPSVLLCDEATSALDPETTRAILDLLVDINRKLGVTIVMVTHEMSVVQRVCDRVAVMQGGVVVEQGSVADVFLSPKHEVTKSMIGYKDPVELAARVNPLYGAGQKGKVLVISTLGELTYSPVLSEVATQTNTSFRFLECTVDRVKDAPFGRFTVEWLGDSQSVDQVVNMLNEKGCRVAVAEAS